MAQVLDKDVVKNLASIPGMEDNYLILTIDYSNDFVFPFKDGLKFLSALVRAEHVKVKKDEQEEIYTVILPMKTDFNFRVIGSDEYKEYKMNRLLRTPNE